MKMIGMPARGHVLKHVGLRLARDPIERRLISHNGESPGLLVDCARSMHCGVDQTPDRLLIHRLFGVQSHRAPPQNRILELHVTTPLASPTAVRRSIDGAMPFASTYMMQAHKEKRVVRFLAAAMLLALEVPTAGAQGGPPFLTNDPG